MNIRVKELRKQMKLSQSDLAEKLGTTQDTVSLWELGKRYPDVEMLLQMADIFDVTIDYLLGRTDI